MNSKRALLEQLQQLTDLCDDMTQIIAVQSQQIADKDAEIKRLKRAMNEGVTPVPSRLAGWQIIQNKAVRK